MSNENNYESVIIRGCGCKPSILHKLRAEKTFVEAFGEDESVSMPFPIRDVFRYDPQVWNELEAAAQADDAGLLEAAWARAVPLACVEVQAKL